MIGFQRGSARLLAGAAFVATVATLMSPLAAATNVAHAYAAGVQGIVRYPIVNGVPARKPDLTIGNATGPLAVSPFGGTDDTVYATRSNATRIVAFAHGGTKPMRSIALPYAGPTTFYSVAAMAVDHAGYLYVAVYLSGDARGASQHGVRYPAPGGVVVYAPNANGHAHPVAAVSTYPEAIALDAEDHLFVCGQDVHLNGFCREYRDARTHPSLVSSFSSPTMYTVFGATVVDSDLYVAAQDPTNKYVFTAQVYPKSSNGKTAPTREIIPTTGSVEGALAAYTGILYGSNGSYQLGGVWEFDAGANGNQPALGSLVRFTYGATGVAIGR